MHLCRNLPFQHADTQATFPSYTATATYRYRRAQPRAQPSTPILVAEPALARVLPQDARAQISIPLPRTIALLVDVVSVLATRNKGKDKVQLLLDRRHEHLQGGKQNIIFTVPKNRLTQRLELTE